MNIPKTTLVRLIAILVVCLVTTFIVFRALSVSRGTRAADIILTTHEIDLGYLDQGTSKTWKVDIVNKSGKDVVISSVQPSCHCLQVTTSPKVAPKMSVTSIEGFLNTKGLETKFSSRLQINLIIRDALVSDYVIVEGYVKTIAKISALTLNYGSIPLGEQKELQFTVSKGESDVAWDDITAIADRLECTVTRQAHKQFTVSAKLRLNDDVIETIHDKLLLSCLKSDGSAAIKYTIPITAQTTGPITSKPRSLFCNALKSGDDSIRTLKILSTSGQAVKFLYAVASNPGVVQIQIQQPEGKEILCNCTINVHGMSGSFAEKIDVHVYADKEYTLSIPCLGFVDKSSQ